MGDGILCPACGCACDDLGAPDLANACPQGLAWFASWPKEVAGAAMIAGQPATLAEGLAAAAALLAAARAPAVFGMTGVAVEAQRAAVALADELGGLLIPAPGPWSAVRRAMQDVGLVTATLGEIRHRAELLVFWDANPDATHPRWHERFVDAPGALLERPRELVFVGAAPAPLPAGAMHLPLPPGGNMDGLLALRLALAGKDSAAPWRELAARLRSARCSAFVFGESLAMAGRWACRALFELVRDLNGPGRCVAVALGPGGNAGGLDSVLAWQTGYAEAVDFGGGDPRPAVAPWTADAVVLIGPAAPPAAWAGVPAVRIGPSLDPRAAVSLRVRVPGLSGGGTWFRDDDVPLPLRPFAADGAPEAAEALDQLRRRLPPRRG